MFKSQKLTYYYFFIRLFLITITDLATEYFHSSLIIESMKFFDYIRMIDIKPLHIVLINNCFIENREVISGTPQ